MNNKYQYILCGRGAGRNSGTLLQYLNMGGIIIMYNCVICDKEINTKTDKYYVAGSIHNSLDLRLCSLECLEEYDPDGIY